MASSKRVESLRPSATVKSTTTRSFTLYGIANAISSRRKTTVDPRSEEEKMKAALAHSSNSLKVFVDAPIQGVLDMLEVKEAKGLSTAEAKARLEAHGRNELPKEPPTPLWKMLLEQLSDLLVILLIVAAIVAMGLGEYAASVVIILIVIANAVLGVVQESRAGAALDALESLSAPMAEVVRDGQIVKIDGQDLVPGDIVILENGKRVPADLRLIESQQLHSNEMPLTGESEPVTKDANYVGGKPEIMRIESLEKKKEGDTKTETKTETKKAEKEEALTEKNMVFMGCDISEGRGKGVVVKTGLQTKMGEVADMLASAESEASPLQMKLHDLGVKLGIASISISLVVFIIGMTTGRGVDHNDPQPRWLQMLLVAVSLTVAAVPEGLPACVTITLAVGMKEMVKKNALIRNLHSVETLGSASVICTDKTGTLTKGVMTAVRLWFAGSVYRITGAGYTPEGSIFPVNVDEKNQGEIEAAVADLSRQGNRHHLPLLVGALSSNAISQLNETTKQWECPGNASERPIVVAAAKAGLQAGVLRKKYIRIKENPFNSHRKMMSTLNDISSDNNQFPHRVPFVACVKGAPNIVLSHCVSVVEHGGIRELTEKDREEIFKRIDEFSEQAFRVLAIAYQPLEARPMDDSPEELEKNLVLCGLVASIDPEREEVGPSIVKARAAGIRVVMITGDYVKTAKAIAENIGIIPKNAPAEKAIDCSVIREIGSEENEVLAALEKLEPTKDKEKDKKKVVAAAPVLSKQEREDQLANLNARKKVLVERLDAIIANADVYARAKPIDKITIVRSLQRQGHVASMTGDGVNDAPALKQANIGVAMGITGTDVAKAASSMVLIDDNFCSIVEAIEQGRTIYNNIQKFVFYLLSTNVSEVFFILIAVIMGLSSPLEPIQILWLNLTTDGAPAIALALEKVEPGVMNEGPRPKKESLIEKMMITGIVIQTITLTTCCLVTYVVGLYWFVGSTDGKHDNKVIEEHGTHQARTMSILYIVFAELLRAYGARSLRNSLYAIGPFSNTFMQYSVLVAVLLTVFVALVPGVQDIFGLVMIDGRAWGFVIGFSFVPITVDELTKSVYRMTGFGRRMTVEELKQLNANRPAPMVKMNSRLLSNV